MQITDYGELTDLISRDDVKREIDHTQKTLKENLARQNCTPTEGIWSAIIAIREGLSTPAILVRYRTPAGRWSNFLGSKKHNWYLANNGLYVQEPDKFLDKYAHEVDRYAVFGYQYESAGNEANRRKFTDAFDVADFLQILGLVSKSKATNLESNLGPAPHDQATELINKAIESLQGLRSESCTYDEIMIEAERLVKRQGREWTTQLRLECSHAVERLGG